ncbi:MAG TPA: SMI1/KNR4 family protein [Pseudonocardiaceae bacterium]|nr:SMI1/KNR4 family protein [Pseudonocardiaceae bacterium]
MNEIERSWQRIENWLRDNAPETYASLNPPASEAAIAEAQEFIGVPFPPDLIASLRIHDGVTFHPAGLTIVGRYAPISVEVIKDRWQMLGDILREQFDSEDMGGGWWHRQWVPIAEDNAACQLIVDARPGEDHDRVAIRDREDGARWHDDGGNWPSYGALLAETADLLTGSKVDDRYVPTVASRRLRWTWRDEVTARPPSLLTMASPPEPRNPVPNSPDWILDAGRCRLTFAPVDTETLIAAFGGHPTESGFLPTIRVGTVGDWAFALDQNPHNTSTDPMLRKLSARSEAVSIAVGGDNIGLTTARNGEVTERFSSDDPDAVSDGFRTLLTEAEVIPTDPQRYVDDDILATLALAIRLGPGEFDPSLLSGPLRTVSVLPMLPVPAEQPRRVHVEFDPDLITAIEFADEHQLRTAVATALRNAIAATELTDHPEPHAALDAAQEAPTGPIDDFSPLGTLLRTQHAEANAAYRTRIDRNLRASVAEADRLAWRHRSELARVIGEFVACPALVAAYSLAMFTEQFSQRTTLLTALADVTIPADAVQQVTEAELTRRPPAALVHPQPPRQRRSRQRPRPPMIRREIRIEIRRGSPPHPS